MAVSGQVESYIEEAQASLREALAFASRSERPFVLGVISDTIAKLDQLVKLDGFMDTIEEHMKEQNGKH